MAPTRSLPTRRGTPTIRSQIEALSRAGWRPPAIACAIDRSTKYVHIALSQLRKIGRLPPLENEKPAPPEGNAG